MEKIREKSHTFWGKCANQLGSVSQRHTERERGRLNKASLMLICKCKRTVFLQFIFGIQRMFDNYEEIVLASEQRQDPTCLSHLLAFFSLNSR